jgi:hypothetical protein
VSSSAVTASRGTAPDEVRLRVESITLEDGWSGCVLTTWALPKELHPASSATPTLDDWRRTLNGIVKGDAEDAERVMLKRSTSAQVFRTRLAVRARPLEVVCKQSRVQGGLRDVLARFRVSRERRTFDRGLALLRAGICTALPLAVFERRRPGKESWLITEALPGTADLERVCSGLLWELDPARFASVKRLLAANLAGLCRRMAARHVYHRDFKASNILISDWDSDTTGPQPWLVDLDGIRLGSAPDVRAEWRGIIRLAASLTESTALTRTDRLRFLKAYLTDRPDDRNRWKEHWRQVARGAGRYLQRSKGRKKGKIDAYAGD